MRERFWVFIVPVSFLQKNVNKFPTKVLVFFFPVSIVRTRILFRNNDRNRRMAAGIPPPVCVPFIDGSLRLPGAFVDFAFDTCIHTVCLIHHFIVQINRAGVFAAARKIPVAVNISGIWIVIAEYSVVDPAHPYISLIRFPVFHFLRSGDHSAQRLCAAVGDPGVFRSGVRNNSLRFLNAFLYHSQRLFHQQSCNHLGAACRLSGRHDRSSLVQRLDHRRL